MPSATDHALSFAIHTMDFPKTAKILGSGVNPNNATGEASHLHGALRNWIRCSQGERPINMLITSAGAYAEPDMEAPRKTKGIALLLMANGARLDHVPQTAAPPYCPLLDAEIWAQPAVRADIMIGALYSAIKRGEPLPKLDAEAMAKATCFTEKNATQPNRDQNDAYTRGIVKMVRDEVRQRLRNPDPEDALACTVARELKDHDRTYWMGAQTEGVPIRRVEMRGKTPT